MATYYKISMQDGTKVDLTLNLGAIAELSKKNKPLANRYFELYKRIQGQNMNELEIAEVIYIGYACAHLNEELPELQDFLYKMTESREEIAKVFQQMFGVQEKKQNFQKHSKGPRKA